MDEKRGGSTIALRTAMQQSRIRIRLPPAYGKLCQSLGGLPPGMAQCRGLTSTGRQSTKIHRFLLYILAYSFNSCQTSITEIH